MKSEQELYDELACYTLTLFDKEFIHQHIVDAYGAQRADRNTKPIRITFALAGLYLYLEKIITENRCSLNILRWQNKKENGQTSLYPPTGET
jgi:hypothetical protein